MSTQWCRKPIEPMYSFPMMPQYPMMHLSGRHLKVKVSLPSLLPSPMKASRQRPALSWESERSGLQGTTLAPHSDKGAHQTVTRLKQLPSRGATTTTQPRSRAEGTAMAASVLPSCSTPCTDVMPALPLCVRHS